MNTKETTATRQHDQIKLGLDTHAKWYDVARQVDGATPQPVHKIVKHLSGLKAPTIPKQAASFRARMKPA